MYDCRGAYLKRRYVFFKTAIIAAFHFTFSTNKNKQATSLLKKKGYKKDSRIFNQIVCRSFFFYTNFRRCNKRI